MNVLYKLLLTFLVQAKTIIAWSYYCNLSCTAKEIEHVVCTREPCAPAPHCGQKFKMDPLSDEEKDELIYMHNYYRNAIASGFLSGMGFENASNMQTMSYSKELEFIAQCWAHNCNVGGARDKCHRTIQTECVGQSIYFLYSRFANTVRASVQQVVDDWFELHEHIKDPPKMVKSFQPPRVAAIDHFTQLVWATTTNVGCGRAFYGQLNTGHNLLVICNYATCGNVVGEPIYKTGEPCTACDEGQECNEEFPALCGRTRELEEDPFEPPFVIVGAAFWKPSVMCLGLQVMFVIFLGL